MTKDAPIALTTQEISSVLGAGSHELGTKAKYTMLIISYIIISQVDRIRKYVRQME